MIRPEEKYIPTTEEVKAAWLNTRSATFMEKIEYDIGFDLWVEELENAWTR